MQFRPIGKKKEIVKSDRIPYELQRLRVPGSLCSYSTGNFGYCLLQESRWNGMTFHQLNLFINQRTVFEISTNRTSVFLLYLLKGRTSITLNRTVMNAGKNSSWLCYFPAGKQMADFRPTQHQWFVVRLKLTYLAELAEKLPEVKKLMAHAKSHGESALWLEIGRISHRIRQLIRKITGCIYESPERELYIQSRVKELLAFCALHLKATRKAITDDLPSKDTFTSYIAQRINETMTIETIASDFHTSASVLKKKFRVLFGVPIHHYIQEQRLQRARHLVTHTLLSVYAIALRTGFTDPSHLIKCFKFRFGDTPGRFRKNNPEQQ